MNYDSLKKVILAKKYIWFEKPFELNIVGVRTSLIHPNIYNDIMCIAFLDEKGVKNYFTYTITTLPGKFWLNEPSRPEGCAIVMPGQYLNIYVKGIHGHTRPHEALIQYGSGINIWRDNDRDDIPEFEGPKVTIEKNVFIGANLHASWAKGERFMIDKDSAACQVAAENENHEQYLMQNVYNLEKHVLGYIPTCAQIMADKAKKCWVLHTYTLLVENDLKLGL